MLLGMLVGWRLGWQKAALNLRAGSSFQKASVLASHRQTDHTASPVKEARPVSAGTDECAPVEPGSLIQAPSSGLTICEQGRVIFRAPQATVAPVKNSPPASRSGPLTANTGPR
jgi:hypothetical protein